MPMCFVDTTTGPVRGVTVKAGGTEAAQFRGVPYALPPVGALRWRPPVPAKPWKDVRDCSHYRPAAIQPLRRDKRSQEVFYAGFPEISEDCLYLNITTPAHSADDKLPIFIWLHDGGLTQGIAYGSEADPLALAAQGIVVVSVGQRLNVFGHLALPQLSKEQGGSSGNYGLMDELLALDWIRENIAAFGGDPDRITVGGESGGTVKTCVLASIPASAGKIKRVINLSGLMWLRHLQTVEQAEQKGRAYLEKAGIDPDISLEELRSLPTGEVFKTMATPDYPGDMVIDGALIPADLRECFERYLGDVDFMNGVTDGEADVFARTGFVHDDKKIESAKEFYLHFRSLLGGLYEKYDFPALVKVTDATAGKTAGRLASLGLAARGRTNFYRSLMVSRIFGVRHMCAHPGNRVYTYLFSHVNPKRTDESEPDMLAKHGSDLWYDFNSMRENVPPVRPWRPVDYQVAHMQNQYIGNFIKTGDPNGADLPQWPPTVLEGAYMEISATPEAHVGMDAPLERLIREFTNKEYNIDC